MYNIGIMQHHRKVEMVFCYNIIIYFTRNMIQTFHI